MTLHFDPTRAKPYDFEIAAGHWAWLEGWYDDAHESTSELLATLPDEPYEALDGHDDYDPSMESMKRYPTREAAMDALRRALDRVRDSGIVEPVEVVE